jgi:hypothetical protein
MFTARAPAAVVGARGVSLLGAKVAVGERVGDSIGIGVTVAVMDVTTGQGTGTGATGAVNAAGTVVVTLNMALDAVDLVEVGGLTLGVTSEDETAVSTTVESSLELAAVGDARFQSPAGPDSVANGEPPHAAKTRRRNATASDRVTDTYILQNLLAFRRPSHRGRAALCAKTVLLSRTIPQNMIQWS